MRLLADTHEHEVMRMVDGSVLRLDPLGPTEAPLSPSVPAALDQAIRARTRADTADVALPGAATGARLRTSFLEPTTVAPPKNGVPTRPDAVSSIGVARVISVPRSG